jgi:hypothetical protein
VQFNTASIGVDSQEIGDCELENGGLDLGECGRDHRILGASNVTAASEVGKDLRPEQIHHHQRVFLRHRVSQTLSTIDIDVFPPKSYTTVRSTRFCRSQK